MERDLALRSSLHNALHLWRDVERRVVGGVVVPLGWPRSLGEPEVIRVILLVC